MTAIVIKSDNAKNIKLIASLAEQLGGSVSKLTPSQLEDLQLGLMMDNEKSGKTVSRKAIFKHLDAK